MVMFAVSGAAVLALVCWVLLQEPPPPFAPFIPHGGPDGRAPATGVSESDPAGTPADGGAPRSGPPADLAGDEGDQHS